MLVKEAIQRVQSQYSKGVDSDDTRLSNRHIYSKLKTARSFILAQKKNKHNKINESNYSVLPCIEVIKVDSHECPCVPDTTCGIYRTKLKLPTIISWRDGTLIKSVTSIDRNVKFNATTTDKLLNKDGAKYAPTGIGYLHEDDYLYFYGEGIPDYVKVVALLDDPTDISKFKCSDPNSDAVESCESPLDMEFKLDNALMDVVIAMALKELVEFFRTNMEDKQNDTSEDIEYKR